MKKIAVIRPVSQKAYARFVERINHVFNNSDRSEAMLTALDRYLDGERDGSCLRDLPTECVVAFEMLRFDVDMAIARSEKARMRARRQRVSEEPTVACQVKEHESPAEIGRASEDCVSSDEVSDDNKDMSVAPLTRRQRRIIERGLRPKERWRSLGVKRG